MEAVEKNTLILRALAESQLSSGKTMHETLQVQDCDIWQALESICLRELIEKEIIGVDQKLGSAKKFLMGLAHNQYQLSLSFFATPCNLETRSDVLFLNSIDYAFVEIGEPVKAAFDSQGFQTFVVHDLGRLEKENQSSIWSFWDRACRRQHRDLVASFNPPSDLSIRNWGFEEIIRRESIENIVKRMIKVLVYRVLPYFCLAQRVFERLSPKALCSLEIHSPMVRIFNQIAQRTGLASNVIQMGQYGRDSKEWTTFNADRIHVFGDTFAEIMSNHGIESQKIVITGNPKYDPFIQNKFKEKRAKANNILLFASQPYSPSCGAQKEDWFEARQALFRVIEASQYECWIKPHPIENIELIRKELSGFKKSFIHGAKRPILELMKDIDAFLTFFSSTANDALVLDIPLIVVGFEGVGTYGAEWLKNAEIAFVAQDDEHLSQLLENLSNGKLLREFQETKPKRARYLESYFYSQDGLASRRIVESVKELAGLNRENINSQF